MPNLVGAATQINQSASNVNIIGFGPGYIAYVANSKPNTVYVRRIDETTGQPTGSELALQAPIPSFLFVGAFQLADGSFLVTQLPMTGNSGVPSEKLYHFSGNGDLLSSRDLDKAPLAYTGGLPSVAVRPDGGYDILSISSLTPDGKGGQNATLTRTSYSASDVATGSQTIATQTFAAAQTGFITGFESYSPDGAVVTAWTAQVSSGIDGLVSSTVNILLPGLAVPIVYTAPPSSGGAHYSVAPVFVGFEPDGSVVYSILNAFFTTNSTTASSFSTDVYHVVGGSPQLLLSAPGITVNPYGVGYGVGYFTGGAVGAGGVVLANGDIALFDYTRILGSGKPTISLYSPQGQNLGLFTGFLGATSGGELEEFYTRNGNLYVQFAQEKRLDDFLGSEKSDLLLQNSAGAVAIGELGASDQLNYFPVAALDTEWKFKGNGDFLGGSKSQFLIENASGTVVVGDVQSGSTAYTTVAGLGTEWTFVETGSFLGNGHDQFLIENTSGAVVVADVQNGHAQYTQVAALGSEWKFKGAGDYLGKGHDQFLIENDDGAVVVGDVQDGQTTYTRIAALGSEWKFVGTGDYLGDGHDSFLIQNNTSGAIVVGDVLGGQTFYVPISALGSEWSFIGTGDYLGDGTADFVIKNTAGAVVLGTISTGLGAIPSTQTSYTQIGALGSEWQSRA